MVNSEIRCLNYIKDFKCIGGSCKDNCCIGWDVDIDIETFKKYKNMKESSIYDRLEKYAVLNNDCFDEKIDYGRMILKSEMRCPFLAEDNLCDIQRFHGENLLSKVCNSYPRVVNLVDGVLELSATISCPEIARMVLLSPESLTIDEFKGELSRYIITGQVDTKSKKLKNHPAKYFNELRKFSIDLIKNKKYKLMDRIFILGEIQYKMLPFYSGKDVDKIPEILNNSQKKIQTGDYKYFLSYVKGNHSKQLEFFFENTKILDDDVQVESQMFGKYFKASKEGLGIFKSNFDKKNIEKYIYHKVNYEEKFFNENEQIFENFIVNFMYKGMYPFSEKGDPYAGYTMVLVRIFLIRTLLVGLSSNGEKLTPQLTVDLIQSFSKTLDHHKTYMNEFLNYLVDSGSDDLECLMELF